MTLLEEFDALVITKCFIMIDTIYPKSIEEKEAQEILDVIDQRLKVVKKELQS